MKRKLIGEEVLALSNEEKINLKYFILSESRYFEDLDKKYICYGIEVESKKENEVETKQTLDITIDEEKIVKLVYMLKRNQVTPVHLCDVIEDLI